MRSPESLTRQQQTDYDHATGVAIKANAAHTEMMESLRGLSHAINERHANRLMEKRYDEKKSYYSFLYGLASDLMPPRVAFEEPAKDDKTPGVSFRGIFPNK